MGFVVELGRRMADADGGIGVVFAIAGGNAEQHIALLCLRMLKQGFQIRRGSWLRKVGMAVSGSTVSVAGCSRIRAP